MGGKIYHNAPKFILNQMGNFKFSAAVTGNDIEKQTTSREWQNVLEKFHGQYISSPVRHTQIVSNLDGNVGSNNETAKLIEVSLQYKQNLDKWQIMIKSNDQSDTHTKWH